MWHGNVFSLKSGRGAARSGGGASRARRSGPRRLQIESLESRTLLSATITAIDLPPAPRRAIAALPAALVGVTTPKPEAHVISAAWYGAGQVKMDFAQTYTDPGEGQVPFGKGQTAWMLGQQAGAPEAWVAGSTPTLYAAMCLSLGNFSFRVEAKGDGLFFDSGKVNSKGKGDVTIDLFGRNTVGDKIDDRQVNLLWYESCDGGPMKLDVTSSQRLFVTHAQPLNADSDPTTVKRMQYGCDLAQKANCAASNITAIAGAIDNDAMNHYTNRMGGGDPWTGADAWQVLTTKGGVCADCSYLMQDALGQLGVASDVYYIYPRAATAYSQTTGQVTHTWDGLRDTMWSMDEYRTDDYKTQTKDSLAQDYLGYVDRNGWENYEACCYVAQGKGYYLGGDPGVTYPKAIQVLDFVTNFGANQRWCDEWTASPHFAPAVPYPTGSPPTY